MSDWAWLTSAVLLGVAAVGGLARTIRRGGTADRALGLDLLLLSVAGGIVVSATRTGVTDFLPVVTVVAFLAFLTTATIARFLDHPARARPSRPQDQDR